MPEDVDELDPREETFAYYARSRCGEIKNRVGPSASGKAQRRRFRRETALHQGARGRARSLSTHLYSARATALLTSTCHIRTDV